jgi:enoyl-CoA hydratase/carnithine racemase
MFEMLMAIVNSTKPIIAVCRGGAYGIAFTILSHVTLIYASPDCHFKTPFIASS